jgi:hypothetical protein
MGNCLEKFFIGCVLGTIAIDGGGTEARPTGLFIIYGWANGSGGTALFIYEGRNWRKSP